eukprot:1555958-Heterocapsa_arctica.AAC.1
MHPSSPHTSEGAMHTMAVHPQVHDVQLLMSSMSFLQYISSIPCAVLGTPSGETAGDRLGIVDKVPG